MCQELRRLVATIATAAAASAMVPYDDKFKFQQFADKWKIIMHRANIKTHTHTHEKNERHKIWLQFHSSEVIAVLINIVFHIFERKNRNEQPPIYNVDYMQAMYGYIYLMKNYYC